jgi:hypothetical protein
MVENIKLQLVVVKEVLCQLEAAQDTRSLQLHEKDLRKWVRLKSLGLSSFQLSLPRQESRLLWL